MNIAEQLAEPFNSFVIDVPANIYYDFELGDNSEYPLKGVTYPVDYGHIVGYTTEDKYELDLFVGNAPEGLLGSIVVDRGSEMSNERKFYIALSASELDHILRELNPVLIAHNPVNNVDTLLDDIDVYKDNNED